MRMIKYFSVTNLSIYIVQYLRVLRNMICFWAYMYAVQRPFCVFDLVCDDFKALFLFIILFDSLPLV
jgi:hypothetical protein